MISLLGLCCRIDDGFFALIFKSSRIAPAVEDGLDAGNDQSTSDTTTTDASIQRSTTQVTEIEAMTTSGPPIKSISTPVSPTQSRRASVRPTRANTASATMSNVTMTPVTEISAEPTPGTTSASWTQTTIPETTQTTTQPSHLIFPLMSKEPRYYTRFTFMI